MADGVREVKFALIVWLSSGHVHPPVAHGERLVIWRLGLYSYKPRKLVVERFLALPRVVHRRVYAPNSCVKSAISLVLKPVLRHANYIDPSVLF